MATGYLGPNIWDNSTYIVTQISSESSNTYASDTSTAPRDASKVIKMASDEYPTGISFSGCPMGNCTEQDHNITLHISNKEGTIHHALATVSVDHGNWAEHQTGGNNGETIIVRALHRGTESISKWNKTNQGTAWTDLTNAYLAVIKEGHKDVGLYWYDSQVTVSISTAYIQRSVTLSHNEGGTITFADGTSSPAAMSRGSSKQIKITANRGYKIVSVNSSGGSLSVQTLTETNATYNFTMSTPAVDSTVSVVFVQNIFDITKSISVSGAGTVTGPDSAIAGESVTVTRTITSDEYRFDGWTIKAGDADVDYTESADKSTATFIMPAKNVFVTGRYTAHAITWSGANITASQASGSTEIVLAYRGIATDSLGRDLTYWIYRNGVKDGEIPAPGLADKITKRYVDSGDEDKEIRFSLVAEADPLTSGGATVSLNVGPVNRTVKYCKKSGKTYEWVECVSYFCVGPKYEQDVNGTNVLHYVRVSYPGTYIVNIIPIQNETYTFKNNSDEAASIVLKDEGENGTSNTVELDPGEAKTATIVSTRRTATFAVSGEGSVEIISSDYPDTYKLLGEAEKVISGVWVEVEPYYFSGPNGWQLCSFV